MYSPATIHSWMSGEQRGIAAALFRGVSAGLEIPMTWYVRRKNRAYDDNRNVITQVAAPVISVGNLTTGGTGKTPLVEWLARELRAQGKAVVLLSRGYGAGAGQANDEALELAAKLPDVPHLQHSDRVHIAQQAVQEYPGSVIVLDDGFQHRRLHRDLDIVLLDATNPFGYEHLLPRGLLREPVDSLRRADVIVLTRTNQISATQRDSIEQRVHSIAPHALWCETMHVPSGLMNKLGESRPLETLQNTRVAAFCAIGNPEAFRRTLHACGCKVVAWQAFPDHHRYQPQELMQFASLAQQQRPEIFVCTAKDLVKIATDEPFGLPLWSLHIALEFRRGQATLNRKIAEISRLAK